jgi:hypothetical protein
MNEILIEIFFNFGFIFFIYHAFFSPLYFTIKTDYDDDENNTLIIA